MSRREAVRAMRETLRADYARTTNKEDRRTVFIFRLGQAARHDRLLRVVWKVLDRTYMALGVNAEMPPTVTIGPGLLLRHAGRGVVLHPDAVIGANATLFHGVTIGQRGQGRSPVIGDDCYLGVDCKVLGPITLGDGVSVGAGAVLLTDAPDGATMVGVPARARAVSA